MLPATNNENFPGNFQGYQQNNAQNLIHRTGTAPLDPGQHNPTPLEIRPLTRDHCNPASYGNSLKDCRKLQQKSMEKDKAKFCGKRGHTQNECRKIQRKIQKGTRILSFISDCLKKPSIPHVEATVPAHRVTEVNFSEAHNGHVEVPPIGQYIGKGGILEYMYHTKTKS
ncbi:hypothetical protein OUZ56_003546 [Daphnia magna]|uniref:CCHC-type domain-containing protein n=1 Tax=Daphnia magna TaxID=35525 RepID=A0ABR0A908_9CRUS|nr:hypothetical protein OUZ56_003546 [Daphnia magna]